MKRVAPWVWVVLAFGCGERDSFWDADVPTTQPALATDTSVFVIDAPAERVVELKVGAGLSLETQAHPLGRTPVAGAVSLDRTRALVLTHGDVPRTRPDDQTPALFAFTASTGATRYPLTDPLSSLYLDPSNEVAIISAAASDQFITNPNELVLVDLRRAAAADNPRTHTVRSFGGRPTHVSALPPLGVPGGDRRRLLLTESDREIGLVDLEDTTREEITIRLAEGKSKLLPGAVAADEGDPTRADDTRIAALLANEATMLVVELLPPTSASQGSMRAFPTLVTLPGVPSAVLFARTDAGTRIAALMPSRRSLALVDPTTYAVTEIDVDGGYTAITRVDDIAGAGVGFVLTGPVSQLSLLSLADTVGKPYRSVETLSITAPVARVFPPFGGSAKMVLELGGSVGRGFAVLDLGSRSVAPLFAARTGVAVNPTFDGGAVIVTSPGTSDLSSVSLADLHPVNVILPRPIASAFDIARPGGRAVVALHATGALGVTVLDAATPSLSAMKEYAGVLAGGQAR